MKLNLGSGQNPLPGWINVDLREPCDLKMDLDCAPPVMPSFPHEDDSVDEFFASHLLEHIVNLLPLMQACWRIAKPGARFVARVPYGSSDDADEDPTHVRRFFLNSFGYMGQPWHYRGNVDYTGDWDVQRIYLLAPRHALPSMSDIMTKRNVVSEMVAEMVAVKPARARLQALIVAPQIIITDR